MIRRRPLPALLALAFVVFAASLVALRAQPPDFDLLIANGRIVDGSGAPWFYGDVGIKGDRIAAVGQLKDATATTRVNATGLVVAPGFIDMLGQSEFNVLVDGRAASKVTMGVTTEVTGEGASIAPVTDRMMEDNRRSPWQHFGIVRTSGHWAATSSGSRREAGPRSTWPRSSAPAACATTSSASTIGRPLPGDLEKMKQLVAQAMEEGALGLSTSLQYVPDRFASTDEIVELAKVARRYGGIYMTHQRSESGALDASMDEVFRIAREAQVPAEIWHFKTAYQANWGRMPAALARLEAARAQGLDVTADIYPYTRASNGLDACLPLWVREGGADKAVARLQDPALRERIKRDMIDPESRHVGEPVVRVGWRRRRDGVGSHQRRPEEIRGQDAHRDRRPDGEGPA
jgi:dihydroorotase/N-acyl-D-amino-acid deacylase